MQKNPDIEASLRELAGSSESEVNIRAILDQLSTSSLREAFEEIQKQREDSNGLYSTITSL